MNKSFLKEIAFKAKEYNVPLIFDEVQTGFGTTGKLWFFEHLDIIPDMVLFGKKTQVSGLMTIEKLNGIFDREHVNRLEVTWNSDTIDMIRCKHIIKTFQNNNVLGNVNERGEQMFNLLSKIDGIEGLRSKGLIIGFDLKDAETRDRFMKVLDK